MTCDVCFEEAHFRWTDTHGVAVCGICGTPYRLYHYNEQNEREEKPPSLQLNDEGLAIARQYWSEKRRRVFPGSFDMGTFRSRGCRTYSGATEDDIESFGTWYEAHCPTPQAVGVDGGAVGDAHEVSTPAKAEERT